MHPWQLMHCEMTQPKQQVASAERILMQLKKAMWLNLMGAETFTKWAGLVVAPDMESSMDEGKCWRRILWQIRCQNHACITREIFK
jgi:hypothetical protein